MLQEKLCQIGFTNRESRIYLELLQMGPQPASVVAKRLKINRTTTYSILSALEKKGILSSYVKQGVRLFVASDPNCLVGYLDRQSRIFDYYKSAILPVLPEFRELKSTFKFDKPVVTFFEGVEGIEQLMEDVLKVEDGFLTFFAVDQWLDHGLEDFLVSLKQARTNDEKGEVKFLRAIVPDTATTHRFFNEHYDLKKDRTELLYVDPDLLQNGFSNDINIYGNKVSILHLEEGQEYGVLIESEQVANMHKGIFDMAWKGFESCNL